MPSELDATTDVVTLAEHADGLGEAVARRLEDHGIETVADILIAEEGALTDVPYVSELRADTLRELADGIVDVGPRDVDFDATESVVSETALPLSVRRGETVLAARLKPDRYHTTDCQHVRQDTNLVERSWRYVDSHDLEECSFCSGEWQPGIRGYPDEEPEPLVDSREVVLEATLGEKLDLTMAERPGYADPWAVIETEEPTQWETPDGDTWRTRRIRISRKMSGNGEDHHECDLVVGADEIRIEDPPGKRVSHQPDVPSWRVESVGAVGRVGQTTYYQLVGQQEQANAKPEGDDTWRKYQRGDA